MRIPCALTGGYGFKPSSGRLPYQNVPVSTEGQEHVPSSVGPMARSLSTIVSTMRLLTNGQPWLLDPRCVPMPWRPKLYNKAQSGSLVIGVMEDDGVVRVHPPIRRAIRHLAAKLRLAGHEIVPWTPDGHAECIEIMDKYYTADGGEDIRRAIDAGGEPYLPRVEALVNAGPAISVYEYWQLNKRKVAAQKAYLDKWNKARSETGKKVDILLTPTMPHTAVPHRCCRWVGYTKVWNFLDYTALSFPVSEVEERDVMTAKKVSPGNTTEPRPGATPEAYEGRNETDKWNWALWEQYKERMVGHPIELQIVGRKLEEEKVLGAAAVIEEVWRGKKQ